MPALTNDEQRFLRAARRIGRRIIPARDLQHDANLTPGEVGACARTLGIPTLISRTGKNGPNGGFTTTRYDFTQIDIDAILAASKVIA